MVFRYGIAFTMNTFKFFTNQKSAIRGFSEKDIKKGRVQQVAV